MSYDNPWIYKEQVVDTEDLKSYCGFVYIITNLINNRKYIGKKLLTKSKIRRVKGKKKKSREESDWKSYYGSNKELQEEVIAKGSLNFKREILRLCLTKGECNYFEAKYQFEFKVLESDDFYNSWVQLKVHKSHLKHIIKE